MVCLLIVKELRVIDFPEHLFLNSTSAEKMQTGWLVSGCLFVNVSLSTS